MGRVIWCSILLFLNAACQDERNDLHVDTLTEEDARSIQVYPISIGVSERIQLSDWVFSNLLFDSDTLAISVLEDLEDSIVISVFVNDQQFVVPLLCGFYMYDNYDCQEALPILDMIELHAIESSNSLYYVLSSGVRGATGHASNYTTFVIIDVKDQTVAYTGSWYGKIDDFSDNDGDGNLEMICNINLQLNGNCNMPVNEFQLFTRKIIDPIDRAILTTIDGVYKLERQSMQIIKYADNIQCE